jgi:hypothetical protein
LPPHVFSLSQRVNALRGYRPPDDPELLAAVAEWKAARREVRKRELEELLELEEHLAGGETG